jgi:hypothetical protein
VVCKNALQNLDGKELRGQNLDSKGLTATAAASARTASALTMICLSNVQGKVGRHQGRVNFWLAGHPDTIQTKKWGADKLPWAPPETFLMRGSFL